MSDDEVGKGRPPKHSRFNKGVSGNLKGRPKRKRPAPGEIINNVLNGSAEYLERGRAKKAPRCELTFKAHLKRALKGDVGSAETLLKLREHAQKFDDRGTHQVEISDWLPDYPGQTAEQKTSDFSAQDQAELPAWWKRPDVEPTSEGS